MNDLKEQKEQTEFISKMMVVQAKMFKLLNDDTKAKCKEDNMVLLMRYIVSLNVFAGAMLDYFKHLGSDKPLLEKATKSATDALNNAFAHSGLDIEVKSKSMIKRIFK